MSEKESIPYGAIALGVLAVGGVYWLATRKNGDVVGSPQALTGPTPDAAPLALQPEGAPTTTDTAATAATAATTATTATAAAPSGGGQNASLTDGSAGTFPDLSALPWGSLAALQTPAQANQEGLADKFGTAALYQWDPWHPDSYVLSAEGVRQLATAPLSTYLLDHDVAGGAAVFHSMSDPSISSAKNDSPRYSGPNTVRSTVEGGNAVFFAKQDLDDLQFGKVASTLTFAATKDGAAWLSSPNAALYNVRVRPSIEGMPAAYTMSDSGGLVTPYGLKLFNDNLPNGYVDKTTVNVPVDGATKYETTNAFSAAYKKADAVVAAARAQGLMIYTDQGEMDSLTSGVVGVTVDFYLVWPGTVMPSKYIRVS